MLAEMVRDLERRGEEFDSSNLLFEWFTEVLTELMQCKTWFEHVKAKKNLLINADNQAL